MEKQNDLKIEIDFEELKYDDLQEIEEVITPSDGTYYCC